MSTGYDNPGDQGLREKLIRTGEVRFLLSKKQFARFRAIYEADKKLDMTTRSGGWQNRIQRWFLAFVVALRIVPLPFFSPRISDLFAFLVINRRHIASMHGELISENQVSLTFSAVRRNPIM